MKQYTGDRARRYEQDRVTQDKWRWEDAEVKDFLADHADAIGSIIDAPVGTGRFLSLYRVPCVGYDVSADMLAIARERYPEARLVQHDLLQPLLEQADLVVSVRFLNLLPTPLALVALAHLLAASKRYALFTCRTVADADPRGSIGRVYLHRESAILQAVAAAGFRLDWRHWYRDNVAGHYDLWLVERQ